MYAHWGCCKDAAMTFGEPAQQTRESYLGPAALLSVLTGTSAACQGRQESQEPCTYTPGSIKRGRKSPSVWVGGSFLGWLLENRSLMPVPMFVVRGQQMCVAKTTLPHFLGLTGRKAQCQVFPPPCPPHQGAS
jgi:hypothetical protein